MRRKTLFSPRFFSVYRKVLSLVALLALAFCLLYGAYRLFAVCGGPGGLFACLFTDKEELLPRKEAPAPPPCSPPEESTADAV